MSDELYRGQSIQRRLQLFVERLEFGVASYRAAIRGAVTFQILLDQFLGSQDLPKSNFRSMSRRQQTVNSN